MRHALIVLKFAVTASAIMSLSSYAEVPALTDSRVQAQGWLRRVHRAAQTLNYSGTFVYEQASQMRTTRITHLLDGKTELEKLEILDGKPREYIRRNEEIICYVPELKTRLIEKRFTQDVFPAILADSAVELIEHYDIQKGESGRVAGFDCQTLLLAPKDQLRYGYKFWAEKKTGLLMRAQTLNEQQEVVEQIAFTHLIIGNVDPARVQSSYPNTTGWHTEKALTPQAIQTGWSVTKVPPGFQKIHEIKRMISDTPALATEGSAVTGLRSPQHEVSQLVYSDGLAAISVFIEPVSRSRTEGSMQQGAMNVTGKRQGDFWLTVVGEVPAAAIKQVANSIQFIPH